MGTETDRAATGREVSGTFRQRYRAYYESDDLRRVGREEMPEQHQLTCQWIERFSAQVGDGLVLELGCGKGPLSRVHSRYVGLDFSLRALRTFSGSMPSVSADMQALPFHSSSIAFIFSWAAIEHVPHPELVLSEVERVLRPGGVALLAPAWNCRSWAAQGLPIKSYRDLDWRGRLQKLSIPVRDNIVWRALGAVPKRVFRELKALRRPPLPFEYGRLNPNLEEYVYTDCDAFSSMDPHAAILYFATRGWEVLSHSGLLGRMLSRHEPVVVLKPPIS